ncbi:PLDc N-terminal domain-containing protein [Lutibacter sp. B1]|uniref:PLDc N-terminal domain-containing protein n=1 Tax=Lutibacter sp. B1 TaxID=2725996 RepID=UPI0014567669|nr:PLDc N-terminal domain-containing protein [Lutibacter sp. B1]NLP58192.1 hypothetical protein [Lutibacter sp. B1]
MRSSTKIWLGIFTFLPFILFIVFFIFFFIFFLENIIELENHQNEFPIEFIQSLFGIITLIIIAGLTSLGIKIYYIVHTINNPENETNKKIMWTLILVFAGIIGSVVYYFIEILPLKPKLTESNPLTKPIP